MLGIQPKRPKVNEDGDSPFLSSSRRRGFTRQKGLDSRMRWNDGVEEGIDLEFLSYACCRLYCCPLRL